MIVALVGCAALFGLGLVFILWKRNESTPTKLARRALERQIGELRRELQQLGSSPQDFEAQQEARVREKWIATQLERTPVDALNVPGTGPAAAEALRENGISSVGDLARLGNPNLKVAGIGPKKTSDLLHAYQKEMHRLFEKARRLDREALDQVSGGQLGKALSHHADA